MGGPGVDELLEPSGDALGGRAMSSAKRWLQYRIVPSAASVRAPSRICSTISR